MDVGFCLYYEEEEEEGYLRLDLSPMVNLVEEEHVRKGINITLLKVDVVSMD